MKWNYSLFCLGKIMKSYHIQNICYHIQNIYYVVVNKQDSILSTGIYNWLGIPFVLVIRGLREGCKSLSNKLRTQGLLAE